VKRKEGGGGKGKKTAGALLTSEVLRKGTAIRRRGPAHHGPIPQFAMEKKKKKKRRGGKKRPGRPNLHLIYEIFQTKKKGGGNETPGGEKMGKKPAIKTFLADGKGKEVEFDPYLKSRRRGNYKLRGGKKKEGGIRRFLFFLETGEKRGGNRWGPARRALEEG